MKDLQIRKASVGDEGKIVDISIKTWETTYGNIFNKSYFEKRREKRGNSEKWWREHLSSHHNVFVALKNDNIIGFIDFNEQSRSIKNYTEIGSIYILRDYQNQGIGRKFFEIALELTKKLGKNKLMLNVLENNPAVGFYVKMGGKQIGTVEIEIDGKKCKEIVMEFNV